VEERERFTDVGKGKKGRNMLKPNEREASDSQKTGEKKMGRREDLKDRLAAA